MKINKAFLFGIPIIGLIFTKEIYSAGLFLYDIAVGRSNKMFLTKCVNIDEEADILFNNLEDNEKELNNWTQNTPTKYYNIASYDGLILFGTVFVQKQFTDKWVIIMHGYGGVGEMMNYAAKKFYENGYNVVVPDCRGHGKSQGDYIGMGWSDRIDVIAWAEKIINGNKNAKIILYGVSMGGAAVLMASGEKLPENIKCIIEDCAYTSVKDIFSYHLKNVFNIPSFPVINIVSCICKLRTGYSFKKASAIESIKRCTIPILFFHGGKDKLVPTSMVCKLYSKAKCPKDMYIVKQAGHGVSAMVEENIYWGKVFSFIKKHCSL